MPRKIRRLPPRKARATSAGQDEPPRGTQPSGDAYRIDLLAAVGRHDAEKVLTALLEAAVAAVPQDRRARLTRWFDDVKATYVAQCLDPDVGPTTALAHLQRVLHDGLPRRSRSAADDVQMVRLRDELLEKLRPWFPPKRIWRSLSARNAKIGPFVDNILRRPVPVSDLPRRERLDGFVTALLEAEKFPVVRRSRAAGRQRQREGEQRARQERWRHIPLTRTMLAALKALGLGEQFVAALRHDGAGLVLRPSLTDPGGFVLDMEIEPPSSRPTAP